MMGVAHLPPPQELASVPRARAVEEATWGQVKSTAALAGVAGKLVVSNAAAGIPDRGHSPRITVMTRNVYLGGPIGPILGAGSLAEIPALVTQMLATIQASDFPARAQALADEITAARPELVGLQEVSVFRIQFPGDYLAGNPVPAETVVYDYLELLLDELAARGSSYVAVAIATGADIELPSALGEDLRMTDRDVILARSDVAIGNAQTGNYSVDLTVPVGGAGGPPVTLLRTWASVDATVYGQTIRFMNTHLETRAVWAPTVDLDRRIDLLFARDKGNVLLGAQTARVVGADPSARTAAGLWPADHAGVVAELRIRPAPHAYQSMPHGGLVVSEVK